MEKFNVLTWDVNHNTIAYKDIIPYLVGECKSIIKQKKDSIRTINDLEALIVSISMYRFWSRCEYEIIVSGWPPKDKDNPSVKIDVYNQIMANIDIITKIVQEEINKHKRNKIK
jgi:hypothetical protein